MTNNNENPFLNKDISFRKEFFFLSNLYPCLIKYKNLDFPSSEHLYQYLKVTDEPEGKWWKDAIINSEHPKIAKKIGNSKNLPHKFNINNNITNFKSLKDFKINNMKIALKAKFYDSNKKDLLQKLLLDTKNHQIIERNSWKDVFWGQYCVTGMGKNNLGILLMEIRNTLNSNLLINLTNEITLS